MIQTEIKLPIIATKLDGQESREYWRYYTAIKVLQYQYHHIPLYAKTWCSSNSAISPRVRSFEFFPPERKRVVCELSALGFSHSQSLRHCIPLLFDCTDCSSRHLEFRRVSHASISHFHDIYTLYYLPRRFIFSVTRQFKLSSFVKRKHARF